MGCDIHLYREKFVNGVWQSADTWTLGAYEPDRISVKYADLSFTDRNYELFATLAKGVRQDIEFAFVPRGIPFDVTELVKSEAESYGVDGHSHSYLFLHELKAFAEYGKTKTNTITGMKDSKSLKALKDSIANGTPDWNLLYPYCSWTNQIGFEEFEIEVPVDFTIGRALTAIIDSFDGVEGDNHRIVFWFDN